MNGYPSFYPRLALVTPSPDRLKGVKTLTGRKTEMTNAYFVISTVPADGLSLPVTSAYA